MRGLLVLCLVLPLLAPTATAHMGPGSLNHVSPSFGPILAGANKTFHLTFENSSFVEDWVFLIYGAAYSNDHGNETLWLTLLLDNQTVTRWGWSSETFHLNTTRLPATAEYDLRIDNPNPEPMSYIFYFDQSCDCLAKPIVLPGGSVLFNYEFPKAQQASFAIPTIDGWTLRAQLATRLAAGSVWPEDFRVLDDERQAGQGWLRIPWNAKAGTTYYVMVQALQGVHFDLDPSQTRIVDVTPLLEHKNAPGTAVPILLLAVLAAVLLRRR